MIGSERRRERGTSESHTGGAFIFGEDNRTLTSSNLVYHFLSFFSLVSFFFARLPNMRSNSASYFLRSGIGRGRDPFPDIGYSFMFRLYALIIFSRSSLDTILSIFSKVSLLFQPLFWFRPYFCRMSLNNCSLVISKAL